jgi:hypothetical protein
VVLTGCETSQRRSPAKLGMPIHPHMLRTGFKIANDGQNTPCHPALSRAQQHPAHTVLYTVSPQIASTTSGRTDRRVRRHSSPTRCIKSFKGLLRQERVPVEIEPMIDDIVQKRLAALQSIASERLHRDIDGQRRRDRTELFKALAAFMIACAAMVGAIIGLANYLHTSSQQPMFPPGTTTTITVSPAKIAGSPCPPTCHISTLCGFAV